MASSNEQSSGNSTQEALATQALTEAANGFIDVNTAIVQKSHSGDGSTTFERLSLAIPSEGVDYNTKKPTYTLTPMTLERATSPEGTTYTYSDDDAYVESRTVWEADSKNEARTELRGVGAQMEGRYHALKAERIDGLTKEMATGIAYNPKKEIIIRGLRKDRLMRKGPLGRVGRVGIGIRKILGGDLDPLTHN